MGFHSQGSFLSSEARSPNVLEIARQRVDLEPLNGREVSVAFKLLNRLNESRFNKSNIDHFNCLFLCPLISCELKMRERSVNVT
jgi:hypothetical protein